MKKLIKKTKENSEILTKFVGLGTKMCSYLADDDDNKKSF